MLFLPLKPHRVVVPDLTLTVDTLPRVEATYEEEAQSDRGRATPRKWGQAAWVRLRG